MAGIMNKLNSYLYQGEMVNGAAAAVKNGVLMVPGTSTNYGKLVLPSSADSTSVITCIEATELYGVPAYRFRIDKLNDTYYFVENVHDFNDSYEYDYADYDTAVGKFLRAHPVSVGEEFTTNMTSGTVAAGTACGVGTDGCIAGTSSEGGGGGAEEGGGVSA